jgi:signal transduction histidine kinase
MDGASPGFGPRPPVTGADGLLASISRWMTGEPSLVVALSACARLLADALHADGCLVFRVDNDGDLVLVAGYPTVPATRSELRLPEGFGVTGRVAADRIPVTLADDSPRNVLHRQALGLAEGETVSRLCVPARLTGGQCTAVLAVHSKQHRDFDQADVAIAQQAADLVALRVYAGAAGDLIRDYREQWDAVVASTVAAQELERRRVAGDLHDGVTQAIASLAFHLSAAQLALDDGDLEYATAQVADARRLADLAFGETRSAITGLHSPVLEDLGLAAGLVSMARAVPNLTVEVQAQDLILPDHISVSLFRVAQESVHNVVKHAAASKAVIRLVKHGRMVVLSITDDGRGFDPPGHISGLPRSAEAGSGYGLSGMAERVRLIGGDIKLHSVPGEGTTVEITVPNVF